MTVVRGDEPPGRADVVTMGEPGHPAVATVVRLAEALDADDFVTVRSLLDPDVTYRIGGKLHRGADAVVHSYREGSAMARELFDRVEFDHTIVGLVADRTVRVDFSDRLTVAGHAFVHHSVQDIEVSERSTVATIVDQPVAGQRELLDAFMGDHGIARPPAAAHDE